jgi:hypothetical protein
MNYEKELLLIIHIVKRRNKTNMKETTRQSFSYTKYSQHLDKKMTLGSINFNPE